MCLTLPSCFPFIAFNTPLPCSNLLLVLLAFRHSSIALPSSSVLLKIHFSAFNENISYKLAEYFCRGEADIFLFFFFFPKKIYRRRSRYDVSKRRIKFNWHDAANFEIRSADLITFASVWSYFFFFFFSRFSFIRLSPGKMIRVGK